MRYIPQNNWRVLFNNVKVKEDKERLRNFSRLKETKETGQLSAVLYVILDWVLDWGNSYKG